MNKSHIYVDNLDYGSLEKTLLESGKFGVSYFKYKSNVEAIKIHNSSCSFEILPFRGHQIWFLEVAGRLLSQKSIFDYPVDTERFGDSYGAFLIHCGLTNINAPDEGESYPVHGELPFARFHDNKISLGSDDKGNYLEFSGIYDYRNSQDFYWEFIPTLRLYENSPMFEMNINIKNKRGNDFDYFYLCHMNWLGFDGARFIYVRKISLEALMYKAWMKIVPISG